MDLIVGPCLRSASSILRTPLEIHGMLFECAAN
jgi:hypothetical protein